MNSDNERQTEETGP